MDEKSVFTLDNGDELTKALLEKVAEHLARTTPAGWGFTLLYFQTFPEDCMLAVSSIDNKHNIMLLQRYLDRYADKELPLRDIEIEGTIIQ